MSIKTATAAQRQTLRDKLSIATTGAHTIAQNVHAPLSDAEAAPIQLACEAATAALAAVGIGAGVLPATKAIVSNNDTVGIQASTGAIIAGTNNAIVSGGLLTYVKLAPSIAPVVNSVKINAGTVTGTGNFATITVANGVITGIVLSAS